MSRTEWFQPQEHRDVRQYEILADCQQYGFQQTNAMKLRCNEVINQGQEQKFNTILQVVGKVTEVTGIEKTLQRNPILYLRP